MNTQLLLAWWNLIYTVPFLLAVIYLGVYAVSGLTFGDHDIEHDADLDHDIDHDVEADVDADVDADADLDAEADVDHDLDQDLAADADADHDAAGDADEGQSLASQVATQPARLANAVDAQSSIDAPFYLQTLTWLGLGRVPMSIVLMVLMLTWGAIGFSVNQLLDGLLPWGALALAGSIPLAGIGSAGITRVVVRGMSRWLPTSETSAEPWEKLVGCTGEALYDINHNFGLATVRDRRGGLFQVPVRVYEHKTNLPKGAKVLLVDYDAGKKHFYVTEYDLDR